MLLFGGRVDTEVVQSYGLLFPIMLTAFGVVSAAEKVGNAINTAERALDTVIAGALLTGIVAKIGIEYAGKTAFHAVEKAAKTAYDHLPSFNLSSALITPATEKTNQKGLSI